MHNWTFNICICLQDTCACVGKRNGKTRSRTSSQKICCDSSSRARAGSQGVACASAHTHSALSLHPGIPCTVDWGLTTNYLFVRMVQFLGHYPASVSMNNNQDYCNDLLGSGSLTQQWRTELKRNAWEKNLKLYSCCEILTSVLRTA